jgi:hypothetical protein
MKCGESLEQLMACWLLRKNSAPWSYLVTYYQMFSNHYRQQGILNSTQTLMLQREVSKALGLLERNKDVDTNNFYTTVILESFDFIRFVATKKTH